MRRKNVVSVKVKAPSIGLVDRLPPDIADLFNPATAINAGDTDRVCVVAQNMRFEDGVMTNAPGYQRVQYSSSLLTSLASHWKMDEAGGTRFDSFGLSNLSETAGTLTGAAGKINGAVQITSANAGGGSGPLASNNFPALNSSFSVCGWVNFGQVTGTETVFATGENIPFILTPQIQVNRVNANLVLAVTAPGGAPTGTLTSSVALAANTWYFFAARMDKVNQFLSIRINATEDHGANGSWTHGVDTNTPTAYFGNALALPFLADSISFWWRYLSNGELDTVYNTGTGLDYPFLGGPFNLIYQGNVIGGTPKPFMLGTTTNLYLGVPAYVAATETTVGMFSLPLTQIYTGAAVPAGFRWSACDFIDKVLFAQNGATPQYWNNTGGTLPVPGLPAVGAPFYDGVESFFGHAIFWNGNTLTWSDLNDATNYIPIAQTNVTAILATTANFTQPAPGAPVTVTTATVPVSWQNGVPFFVRVVDAPSKTTNYYLVTSATSGGTSVTMTLQNLSGVAAAGTVIASGASLVPLVANEAGSAIVVGSDVNSPILAVKTLGDYAYVFHERAIQSMQYVGPSSGTFYIHTEVTNEGLISRYAFVKLGVGRIIFLGQRELYDYTGGPEPKPVCTQYTRQLFAELDRNNLSQISLLHRELRNEIWVVYPALGGVQKVLIWNYYENTASIDFYDSALQGMQASAMIDWPNDPAWLSLGDLNFWTTYGDNFSWNSFAGAGGGRVAVLSFGDGNLYVHGLGYNRNGAAYTCLAETMDYDFGDDAMFKYVDVVNVGLQTLVQDTVTRNLYIQVGYRSTLDASIAWTTPKAIQIQGNANFAAKVNPGGGGRFIRLRFYSQDADVQWRVARYEIFARAGGTY